MKRQIIRWLVPATVAAVGCWAGSSAELYALRWVIVYSLFMALLSYGRLV